MPKFHLKKSQMMYLLKFLLILMVNKIYTAMSR
jgi:hypothetical protein